MKEDRVLQALNALAESDGQQEASPAVEARLLREFRSRHASRRWPRLGIAAIAAVAAGIVLAAFLLTNRTPKQMVGVVMPAKSVAEVTQPAPAPVAAAVPRRVARRVAVARPPEPREVVTDFFPLMNPAPPFERGQMLRVQLPASAMQAVGLPVQEEHMDDLINADVLVGEEGMPRAIRFVRFDVK